MKSKGFTLIELLAVIVILAVIALIATPAVLNIISNSKNKATLRSAELYVKSLENSVGNIMLNGGTIENGIYSIMNDGNLCLELNNDKCEKGLLKIQMNGKGPNGGKITLFKEKITEIELVYKDKTVIRDKKGKLVYSDNISQSGLYDKDGKLIATWDELVNEYKIDLEKDYYDENGQLTVEQSELPGIKLSQGELSKGIELIIDSSVKKIVSGAFAGNTTLKEIIIPDSVTSIGDVAFAGTSLTEIIIPDSVTSIGIQAFLGVSLTEITIPNSVISIGEYAFAVCQNLKDVTIGDSVTSMGNSATRIDKYAFYYCPNLTEVTIGNNVTSIGYAAFDNCTSLKTVIIGDGVTSIGGDSFRDCTSLTSLTIGKSVTTIEHAAFERCKSLEKVIIPESVTTIESYVFDGCTNLKEITLPKNLASLDFRALSGCTNLKTVNYTGTEEEWNSKQFSTNFNSYIPSDCTINYNYVAK